MHLSSPRWPRPIATLGAILAALGVNLLSNRYSPLGVSVAEISNTTFAEVQIIPANYAFAIWGLIYLALLAYGFYQLQPSQHHNPILRGTGWFLTIASLWQMAWIVVFLYQKFAVSMIPMLGILVALILAYESLRGVRLTGSDRWFVQIPISLYLGWISVATVVNGAIVLYSLKGNNWGLAPEIWTAVMMAVAAGLALVLLRQRGDVTFALVIVWALVAIVLKQLSVPVIVVVGGVLVGLLLLESFTKIQS